jgi:hypothetical protein
LTLINAYIYAIEKKERNGKWKMRGLDYAENSVVSPADPETRTKTLVCGKGETYEDACRDAWFSFLKSPDCRPYVAHAVRLAGTNSHKQ